MCDREIIMTACESHWKKQNLIHMKQLHGALARKELIDLCIIPFKMDIKTATQRQNLIATSQTHVQATCTCTLKHRVFARVASSRTAQPECIAEIDKHFKLRLKQSFPNANSNTPPKRMACDNQACPELPMEIPSWLRPARARNNEINTCQCNLTTPAPT